MQQLRRVYQKYVTQMTNPSTPLLEMWEIALPPHPLRIDAPVSVLYVDFVSVATSTGLTETVWDTTGKKPHQSVKRPLKRLLA